MKTLYILRHAKAERDSDSGKDFDRPLAPRGRDDAQKVGRAMRERGLDPDAVAASPAKRAAETLAAVADGYGALAEQYDRRIYNASAAALIDLVQESDDSAVRLLLVGHNPGFQELAVRLAGEGELRRAAEASFPTAALAVVEFGVDEWRKVRDGSGRIVDLIVPGDLA